MGSDDLGRRIALLRHRLLRLRQPVLRYFDRLPIPGNRLFATDRHNNGTTRTGFVGCGRHASDSDQARNAFYSGDYARALSSLDAALSKTPSDVVLHEFRALCLFALHKYKEAAGTLYAVLSVGPGWDWTTMSGLYSNVDVYTEQLRASRTTFDRTQTHRTDALCSPIST